MDLQCQPVIKYVLHHIGPAEIPGGAGINEYINDIIRFYNFLIAEWLAMIFSIIVINWCK